MRTTAFVLALALTGPVACAKRTVSLPSAAARRTAGPLTASVWSPAATTPVLSSTARTYEASLPPLSTGGYIAQVRACWLTTSVGATDACSAEAASPFFTVDSATPVTKVLGWDYDPTGLPPTLTTTTTSSTGVTATWTFGFQLRTDPATPPPPPPPPPPPAVPILVFRLNEGTGTSATDTSGNGNNGTLINSPTWVQGITGTSLQFDGVDDQVRIAPSASIDTLTSQVTVAAWVYRTTNQGKWVAVISRQLGTANLDHWIFGFSDTGQYRWFVNTTSGYSNMALGGNAPVGQWAHIVGTYDGANVKFYVNGVLQFTTPWTGTFPVSPNGILLGAGSNDVALTPVEAFNGRLDEVRVYATALTATDVATLYQDSQAPLPPTPTPLMLTCPAAVTAASPDGQPVAVQFPAATFAGGTAPVTVTMTPPPGSLFPVATTTVTGNAVDAAGAKTTCTFPVTVGFTPPPPPPPPPSTFTAVVSVASCKVVLTDTPPDTTGGWGVQFQRGTTSLVNVSTRDTASPYSRTATLAVSYMPVTFHAVWTKSGATTVTRDLPPVTCVK